MISAVPRLDLINVTAKVPDKIAVSLFKSAREVYEPMRAEEVRGCPTDSLGIKRRLFEEFKLQKRQPGVSSHEL